MTFDEFVVDATRKTPSIDDVNAFRTATPMALAEFFDRFAETVATRYQSGEMSWQDGLAVMTAIFPVMAAHCDLIPEFADDVFLAFEAGKTEAGAAITWPLLEKAEAKRGGRVVPEQVETMLAGLEPPQSQRKAARARRLAVGFARQIVNGELGIIAGCRLMSPLLFEISSDWYGDKELSVILYTDSSTDHLPLENARDQWDPAAFEAKQEERRRAEEALGLDVKQACRSIIRRFGFEQGSK